MGIKELLKKSSILHTLHLNSLNRRFIKAQKKYGDEALIKKAWKTRFGYDLDLDNPKTLNEKIQWLKLNDRKDIYSVWADKYACRKYIEEYFGKEFLVPLIFKTDNPVDINDKNILVYPCVIKANHSSGDYIFVKNPNSVDWKMIRRYCKTWLKRDYYACSQEWQYKNMKRLIIVEKMLVDKNGKIPNDYKLHFIEGKLVFVYCSIDREGENYRQIYDKDWNLLPFNWDAKETNSTNSTPIEKPVCFDMMCKIGQHFANSMHYIRVDFYECDGKLFCGEITFHHGGGFDKFRPDFYDLYYGEMLNLSLKRK